MANSCHSIEELKDDAISFVTCINCKLHDKIQRETKLLVKKKENILTQPPLKFATNLEIESIRFLQREKRHVRIISQAFDSGRV